MRTTQNKREKKTFVESHNHHLLDSVARTRYGRRTAEREMCWRKAVVGQKSHSMQDNNGRSQLASVRGQLSQSSSTRPTLAAVHHNANRTTSAPLSCTLLQSPIAVSCSHPSVNNAQRTQENASGEGLQEAREHGLEMVNLHRGFSG